MLNYLRKGAMFVLISIAKWEVCIIMESLLKSQRWEELQENWTASSSNSHPLPNRNELRMRPFSWKPLNIFGHAHYHLYLLLFFRHPLCHQLFCRNMRIGPSFFSKSQKLLRPPTISSAIAMQITTQFLPNSPPFLLPFFGREVPSGLFVFLLKK